MIPLFTPVMLLRPGYHGQVGEVRGRSVAPLPHYDVVLSDGITVIPNLPASDFAVTGKPRQVHVIAWEGTAKPEAA